MNVVLLFYLLSVNISGEKFNDGNLRRVWDLNSSDYSNELKNQSLR